MFDAKAGGTYSGTAPTTAPKGTGFNQHGGAGATVNNRGGPTELAPPDTTVPEMYRGDEGKVACYPACSTDPDAAFGANKAAASAYKKSYVIVANVILVAEGLVRIGTWVAGRAAAREQQPSWRRAAGAFGKRSRDQRGTVSSARGSAGRHSSNQSNGS